LQHPRCLVGKILGGFNRRGVRITRQDQKQRPAIEFDLQALLGRFAPCP
jgi:hypothetical protein